MDNCGFCNMAKDGTVACWHLDAVEDCDVKSADIFVDDGITVILRTPDLPKDQRLHIDTLYCPMCGRRYK